jgi:hypothetical protein
MERLRRVVGQKRLIQIHITPPGRNARFGGRCRSQSIPYE